MFTFYAKLSVKPFVICPLSINPLVSDCDHYIPLSYYRNHSDSGQSSFINAVTMNIIIGRDGRTSGEKKESKFDDLLNYCK